MNATETTATIEVCSNSEWMNVFGPISDVPDEWHDEAANDWCRRMTDAIEAMGLGWESARGQRATCHGWNGANTFARHGYGLGTFDAIDSEQWDALTDAAIRIGEEVAERWISKAAEADD